MKKKVAAIVACRLKSSRLKSKALKNIGELTSIELCLKNTLRIGSADVVILATSDLDSDRELEQYTYDPSVVFHRGDPEDVIRRYLDICIELEIDTVIRITGDCPLISSQIAERLLEAHNRENADYTAAKSAAVGTAAEIMEVSALKKIKAHFKSANYSEYMTWYFTNNPEHFKLQFCDLPKQFVRDYRLTLDYQEDLDLFNAINEEFIDDPNHSILDVFGYLDSNPSIAGINSHRTLKYKSDQELIDKLNLVTKIPS
ncbi:MAG: spore coat protein [Flavobacteriales bacterium]|nr:spore coat protein [Flavobacteriales bacterium]